MSARVVVASLHYDGEHVHDADDFDTNRDGELWITRDGRSVAAYARGCWVVAKLVEDDPEPDTDPKGLRA